MNGLLLSETNPSYCLATEEFLLKNRTEEYFMLWQSRNAVVVGKHQNALAEIDYRYIRENGIMVSRRISGGGTVYHDLGNVNYGFIQNVQRPEEISFSRFTAPISAALADLGIVTGTTGRNDLTVDGKKISGTAEHVYKNRVLHHGTLLFSSDLGNLGNALRSTPGKYRGKAVHSVRSEVTNISPFLKHQMTTSEFMVYLLDCILLQFKGSLYNLTGEEEEQIRQLTNQKFDSPEWQYGYSPAYIFHNTLSLEEKRLEINLRVDRGEIAEASITGDFYREREKLQLESLLAGRFHSAETIVAAHNEAGIGFNENLIYSYF